MSGSYAGANTFHANIQTIENGDPTDATTFQTPLTQLTDRTTALKTVNDTQATQITNVTTTANTAAADIIALDARIDTLEATQGRSNSQSFTATGAGVWTKPSNAKSNGWTRITCVGGGSRGSSGGAGTGGAGGDAGEVVHAFFRTSHLPATMDVWVGSGGVIAGSNARPSYVTATSQTLVFANCGGTSEALSIPSDVNPKTWDGAAGGAGGTANSGIRGRHSGQAPGGAPGAVNVGGEGGWGYGAGGGGGRQSSGSNSGGGGGGGGYTTFIQASSSAASANGANGANGLVFIQCELEGP
jgi:hypothetical protein